MFHSSSLSPPSYSYFSLSAAGWWLICCPDALCCRNDAICNIKDLRLSSYLQEWNLFLVRGILCFSGERVVTLTLKSHRMQPALCSLTVMKKKCVHKLNSVRTAEACRSILWWICRRERNSLKPPLLIWKLLVYWTYLNFQMNKCWCLLLFTLLSPQVMTQSAEVRGMTASLGLRLRLKKVISMNVWI